MSAACQSVKKPRKLMAMTQEFLKSTVEFDPLTGEFFWLAISSNRRSDLVGTKAGSEGIYRTIFIGGKHYFSHRLAWLYVYGVMPKMLDHKNGIKHDNRIVNLREANKSKNTANTKLTKRNTTGAKGLVRGRGKDGAFYARIVHKGVMNHLGKFPSLDEAAHAYNKKAISLYGEFAVLNPIGVDK